MRFIYGPPKEREGIRSLENDVETCRAESMVLFGALLYMKQRVSSRVHV